MCNSYQNTLGYSLYLNECNISGYDGQNPWHVPQDNYPVGTAKIATPYNEPDGRDGYRIASQLLNLDNDSEYSAMGRRGVCSYGAVRSMGIGSVKPFRVFRR